MLQLTDEIANNLRARHIFVERGCTFDQQGFIGKNCKIFPGGGLRGSSLGSYSYTASILTSCTIGNYCSIAHAVDGAVAGHPLDRISTSPCTQPQTAASDIFGTFVGQVPFPYLLSPIIIWSIR